MIKYMPGSFYHNASTALWIKRHQKTYSKCKANIHIYSANCLFADLCTFYLDFKQKKGQLKILTSYVFSFYTYQKFSRNFESYVVFVNDNNDFSVFLSKKIF